MRTGSSSRKRPASRSWRTRSIKARVTCAATGLPALADDSGVVVDALGRRPRRPLGTLWRRRRERCGQRCQAAGGACRRRYAGSRGGVRLRNRLPPPCARPVPDRVRGGLAGPHPRHPARRRGFRLRPGVLRRLPRPEPRPSSPRAEKKRGQPIAGRRSRGCWNGSPAEDRERLVRCRCPVACAFARGYISSRIRRKLAKRGTPLRVFPKCL